MDQFVMLKQTTANLVVSANSIRKLYSENRFVKSGRGQGETPGALSATPLPDVTPDVRRQSEDA